MYSLFFYSLLVTILSQGSIKKFIFLFTRMNNKKNESEPIGFDKYFAPTCLRKYSYRYDSYDSKYETLEYTRPKECKDSPLAEDSLCQKNYKVKITNDLRRYTAPARGLECWKTIYKERSSVGV
jgi:transposase